MTHVVPLWEFPPSERKANLRPEHFDGGWMALTPINENDEEA